MAKTLEYIINLTDGSFGRGMNKAKKETAGLDKAIGGLKKFIGAGVLLGIGKQALDFSDRATDVKMRVQSLDNAIKFGNARLGEQNLQNLDKAADYFGQNLMIAKDGFGLLLAGAKGTKLVNQQIQDIYRGTATAMTVMNRSTEDQKGVMLAYSQILSKGTVQAEELRGQIGERIPGAFNIAARAMGVSNKELGKMMERGELMAEDFLPKFAKELEKTFESGLPAAINSTRAQMARLDNQMDKNMAKLGGQLEGVSKDWKMLKVQTLEYLSDILPKADAAKPLYSLNSEMNRSFETLRGLIPNTQEYNALREKINQTYPSYLQNLITEKDTLWDLKYAQDQANEAMRARRQQMIGDERQKEIVDKRADAIKKIAQWEREIAEREGRMALGDKAAWWETSHDNKIKQNKMFIDFYNTQLTNLDAQAKKERILTFKLRFENDRKGLLEDARNANDLAKAMYGENAGDFSKASPQAIANMVTAANRKFGSQVKFDAFGLKQDKKGGWTFDNNDKSMSTTGGGLGGFNTSLSAGRSVRNVTVTIENLIREFTVKTNTLKESMGQVRNTVTDTLNRAVLDAEAAL